MKKGTKVQKNNKRDVWFLFQLEYEVRKIVFFSLIFQKYMNKKEKIEEKERPIVE
jgi:hypothetical protein